MTTEYIAVIFTILFTIATSIPLGRYMARVFTGQRTWLDPILGPVERGVLRLVGVDHADQQDWKHYGRSLLISNVVMWLATFAILSWQHALPINPDGIANMEDRLKTLGGQCEITSSAKEGTTVCFRAPLPKVFYDQGRYR